MCYYVTLYVNPTVSTLKGHLQGVYLIYYSNKVSKHQM